jgi:hypothetical protein
MGILEKLTGKLPENLTKEKRFADRRACAVDVFLIKEGKEPVPGVIRDIGVYGIRVEGKISLKKDEVITVQAIKDKGIFTKGRFKQESISTKVVWCRKKRNSPESAAGLKFSDSRTNLRDSWVFTLLNIYGFRINYGEQRRRAARFPTHLKVKYHEPQGYYNGWGNLIDLSNSGLSMLTNSEIPLHVTLEMEMGPYQNLPITFLKGKVAWSGYSKQQKTPIAGIEFYGLNDNQVKMLNKYLVAIVEELAQK